jgi:hypothetical protein
MMAVDAALLHSSFTYDVNQRGRMRSWQAVG